jgi:hypothetical protein
MFFHNSAELFRAIFENFAQNVYSLKIVSEEPRKRKCPAVRWTKRFGAAAFLFFLVKGLLWLILPAIAAYYAW